MKRSVLVVSWALLGAIVCGAPQTFAPDSEGFIRNWLVLAPIAVQEDSGATEIEKDFLGGEATIKPKPGDKVNVAGKILTWTPHQTTDYFIDFLKAFGTERGEDVAAYAVAYVIADGDMKVRLSVGSNDQCKAWVNGTQIVKFTETRTLDKDTDAGDVQLTKGQNVVVFKVINEKNNWQGAARFLQNGSGVTGLKISSSPQ
jgi:hypothetical protein